MNKLNYRLLIVDDDPDSLEYILPSLRELPFIHEEISIVNSPAQAIAHVKENEVDILMLDMDLGQTDMDGTKLARLIPNPPVMVACSAYPSYVFEANEAGIAAYLSKTTSFKVLKTVMEEMVGMADRKAELQSRDIQSLTMKNLQNEKVLIEVEQIYYACVDDGKLQIFLKDENHRFNGTLQELSSKLSALKFARSRRNTLVNLAMVDLVRSTELYLIKPLDGKPISISRTYRANFKHRFDAYRQNSK
ncbi:MAG: LytTR family DNA-binding domain-containing protein [Sphingobacterium sp.]|jgi:DNA-binding LytR/AlgR family response regulator|uniref:LytR/AlgR family response regulator transcription factor n=1 Tax=Sphingobacterium sp. TaxID=341027 RepID=UPI00284939F3|nr:LytTR family DNA-binding domain-containing protein [Sphingobacterium sp.]MDR3008233.1 LytTR family DNA-binding domain-containing protein [Sphingobacterium sp.]